MNKVQEDKTKYIRLLANYQSVVISDLKQTINDLRQQADLPEGEVIDPEDTSSQSNSLELINSYSSLLRIAENNLVELNQHMVSTGKFQSGSMVYTDSVIFFIGVSVPAILLPNNQILIGISRRSDFFSQLQNKKSGDPISYGNGKLVIRSIQ